MGDTEGIRANSMKTKQTKKQTALADRRMNYPTLLKRQGDYMQPEEQQMMASEHELEIMRRKLWADVWVATASSSDIKYTSSYTSSCTRFADDALKDFDTRFKLLANPTHEEVK